MRVFGFEAKLPCSNRADLQLDAFSFLLSLIIVSLSLYSRDNETLEKYGGYLIRK